MKSKAIPVEVIYIVVPELRCFMSHHKTIGWINLLKHLSSKQSCCTLLTQKALKQSPSNIAKICKTLQKITSAFLWYVLENSYLSWEGGQKRLLPFVLIDKERNKLLSCKTTNFDLPKCEPPYHQSKTGS